MGHADRLSIRINRKRDRVEMANPFSFSYLSGLAVAGVGLGVILGSSAISEIDTAYFRTALSSSSFHADLVANRPAFDSASAPLETASAPLGFGSSCIGCRTYPEEYYPIHDPAVDGVSDSYSAFRTPPAEVILADAERYMDSRPSAVELKNVERYAHYRVAEEEEAESAAPVQEAAPAPAEAKACDSGDQCKDAAAPAA